MTIRSEDEEIIVFNSVTVGDLPLGYGPWRVASGADFFARRKSVILET